MNLLNIFLLACSMAVSGAQRLGVTSEVEGQRRGGGYGLLRPGYNSGYQPGYGGYQSNIGYPGQNSGFGGYGNGGYGGAGYGGGFGSYGSSGYNNGGYGGYPYGNSGYGGQSYPGLGGGYRPNYRPGFDRPGYYPGGNFGIGNIGGNTGYNRPGYQYRLGYDRPFPGNSGNYFGGYSDGYSDSFRRLGRKAAETKTGETKKVE